MEEPPKTPSLSDKFANFVYCWGGAALDASLAKPRRKQLPEVSGSVLDIGTGHGHSLLYLDPSRVTKEPNVAMHPTLKENAEKAGFEESRGNLVVFGSTAEVFDPDCKFDSVVTSCTLCSVSDEVKVIQNIGSWLRPGGKFYFLEHGGDEAGTWRRTIQDWATPMWSTIAGGCTLNRHHLTLIKNAVDEQGNRIFSDVTAEVVGRAHMNDFSPSFIFKPLIVGVATRSDYSTLSDKNVL